MATTKEPQTSEACDRWLKDPTFQCEYVLSKMLEKSTMEECQKEYERDCCKMNKKYCSSGSGWILYVGIGVGVLVLIIIIVIIVVCVVKKKRGGGGKDQKALDGSETGEHI